MKEENKKKLEYEKPELVDFNLSKRNGKTAFGDTVCGSGSGESELCENGASAGGACISGSGGGQPG